MRRIGSLAPGGGPHLLRPSRGLPGAIFIFCFFLLLLMGVGAVTAPPAAADDVPDGCQEVNRDFTAPQSTPGSNHVIHGNGRDFLQCQEEPDGHTCRDIETTLDVTLTEGEIFCTLNGDEFVTCRDDIRFSINGGGDPSRAFLSGDQEGAAIVPQGMPQWWLDEVERVSEGVDREGEDDWGMGCHLAGNAPTIRPCDEIREERGELREEVDSLEARQRAEQEGTNNEGIDPARLEAAREDLDDLEHLGSIVPDGCWGRYPDIAYNLTYDSREDSLNDPSRLLFWLSQMIFGLAKTVLAVALWLVNLALTFDVGIYRHEVADFAAALDQNLVHLGVARLSLFEFAWLALFAAAGFKAIRGRVGPAVAEIVVALVLAALSVALIGDFFPATDEGQYESSVDAGEGAYREDGYFASVSDLLNLSALGLVQAGLGEDLDVDRDVMEPNAAEELLVPFNEKIHREFVERPYLFIQYGTDEFDPDVSLDGTNGNLNCSQVKLALLTMRNPEGRWVNGFLATNGCTSEAARNGTMSMQRLMDTALVVAVAFVVGGVLIISAGTLMMSKFLVAVFFVALPVAAVLAILPGSGRSLAWSWATTLLQLWLAALATGATLAFMLVGIDAVLDTTQQRDLAERWLIVLALMLGVAMVRRRLISGARSVGKSLQQKLAGATAGPEGPRPSWGAMRGQTPLTDVDLFSVDRGVARASVTTRTVGAVAAVGAVGAAWKATRFTHRWTIGGLGRSQLARAGRYREAKWSQWYHWSNSLESRRVSLARDTLQGKAPTRDAKRREVRAEARNAVLHQTYGDALGRTRTQAAAIDAALARKDVETLRSEVGGKRSTPLSDVARAAGQRLGFDDAQLDTWHTGRRTTGARRRLIRDAERSRDRVERAAGGRQTSPEMRRHADRAEQVRNGQLGGGGTTPPPQQSYADRYAVRHRAAMDGVAEDEGERQVQRIEDRAKRRIEGIDETLFTESDARRFLGGER